MCSPFERATATENKLQSAGCQGKKRGRPSHKVRILPTFSVIPDNVDKPVRCCAAGLVNDEEEEAKV